MGTSQNVSSDSNTKHWQPPKRTFFEDLMAAAKGNFVFWSCRQDVVSFLRLLSVFHVKCILLLIYLFFQMCNRWDIQINSFILVRK